MPESINACSNASLACWKASRGFCTQIADSSTKCVAPACRAASSACKCAWWSMAQASLGAPVRDARQDTTASKCSPHTASRSSAAGSPTSATRSCAPGSIRWQSASDKAPPTPARARTTQTTVWPSRCTARTVAWPMVPVAPNTSTRCGAMGKASIPLIRIQWRSVRPGYPEGRALGAIVFGVRGVAGQAETFAGLVGAAGVSHR